jgi:hypothetical protein
MRQGYLLAAGCVLFGLINGPSAAALDVVASGYLSGTHVHTIGGDRTPALAHGQEQFVAVWSSAKNIASADTDWDLFYGVSDDGGTTWTTPRMLHSGMANDSATDWLPAVASNEQGTWMTMWLRGASVATSTSTNPVSSWGAPSNLTGLDGTPYAISLRSTGASWIAALSCLSARFANSMYTYNHLEYALQSDNNGQSWTKSIVEEKAYPEPFPSYSSLAVGIDARAVLGLGSGDGALRAFYSSGEIPGWERSAPGAEGLLRNVRSLSHDWSSFANEYLFVYESSALSDLSIIRYHEDLTWGADAELLTRGVKTGSRTHPKIAIGANEDAALTFSALDPGEQDPAQLGVYFSSAPQAGIAWHDAKPLNPSSVMPGYRVCRNTALATDGAGRWVGAWLETQNYAAPYSMGMDVAYAVLDEPEAPRLTLLRAERGNYAAGDTARVHVRFSTAVTGFNAEALLVSKPDALSLGGAVVEGSLDQYLISLPLVAGGGTVSISLNPAADIRGLDLVPWEPDSRVEKIGVSGNALRLVSMTLASPPELVSGEQLLVDLEFTSIPSGLDIHDFELEQAGVRLVDPKFVGVSGYPLSRLRLQSRALSLVQSGPPLACTIRLSPLATVTSRTGDALTGGSPTLSWTVQPNPLELLSLVAVDETSVASGTFAEAELVFSSAVSGFDAADLSIQVPGGRVGEVVISGSGDTRQVYFRPILSPDASGPVTATLQISPQPEFTDELGNPFVSSHLSATWTVTPDPLVLESLTRSGDGTLRSGMEARATFVFSSTPLDFGPEDLLINVPGGSPLDIAVTGEGAVWECVFRPLLADGAAQNVSVALSIAPDASIENELGNGLAPTNASLSWEVQPDPLRLLSITLDSPAIIDSGKSVSVTFEFSDEPLEFTLEDLELLTPGCTVLDAVLSGEGNTRNFTAKLIVNEPASARITCALGVSQFAEMRDSRGNAFAGSTLAVDWKVDPKPMRLLSMAVLTPAVIESGAEAQVALEFSSPPVGLSTSSLILTAPNAAVSLYPIGGGGTVRTYRAAIIPDRPELSPVNCRLDMNPANTVTDADGNPLVASSLQAQWQVNWEPLKVLDITITPNQLTNGRLLTGSQPLFEVFFNKPVTNFNPNAFVINYPGTRLIWVQNAGDDMRFSVWFDKLPGEGQFSFSVVPTPVLINPASGEGLLESYTSPEFEVLRPLTITKYALQQTSVETDEVAILDISFLRPVTGLSVDSFTFEWSGLDGTAELSGEGADYQLRIRDFTDSGSVWIRLPSSDAIKDEYGLSPSGTQSQRLVINENVLPGLWRIRHLPDENDPDYVIGVEFFEPVTDFGLDDLEFALEGLSYGRVEFTGEGEAYTIRLIDLIGVGALTVKPGPAYSVTGLDGDISTSGGNRRLHAALDRTPPVLLDIVRSAVLVRPGEDFTATYVFNEPVTGVKFLVEHQGTASASQSVVDNGAEHSITLHNVSGEGRVLLKLDVSSIIRDGAGTHFQHSGAGISVGVGLPVLTLEALTRLGGASTTNGPVTFELRFSQDILSLETPDIEVLTEGTATYETLDIIGEGREHAVTLGGISGDGVMLLRVAASNQIRTLDGVRLSPSTLFSTVAVGSQTLFLTRFEAEERVVNPGDRIRIRVEFSRLVRGFGDLDSIEVDSVLEGAEQVQIFAQSGFYEVVIGPVLEEGLVGARINPQANITDFQLQPLSPVPGILWILVDDPATRYDADMNLDYAVTLPELLRQVQFYNAQEYGCQLGSEDGFAPGAGMDRNCAPHASDFAPQDWTLSLGELLRLIQMFNAGGYYPCPNEFPPGEDGHCAFDWINAPAP